VLIGSKSLVRQEKGKRILIFVNPPLHIDPVRSIETVGPTLHTQNMIIFKREAFFTLISILFCVVKIGFVEP
jgi:hypothetical protein